MPCGMTQCDSRARGRSRVCSWYTEPVWCGHCPLAQHTVSSEGTAHLASQHSWQLSQIIYSHFTQTLVWRKCSLHLWDTQSVAGGGFVGFEYKNDRASREVRAARQETPHRFLCGSFVWVCAFLHIHPHRDRCRCSENPPCLRKIRGAARFEQRVFQPEAAARCRVKSPLCQTCYCPQCLTCIFGLVVIKLSLLHELCPLRTEIALLCCF